MTDTGDPPRLFLYAGGDEWNRAICPAPPPASSHRVGVQNCPILAGPAGSLEKVRGLTAWEIASECIDASLASGASPSLGRLGRLGQLGSLPALAAALRTGVNAAGVALDHAREREGLGFGADEVAAELLALGRVFERHGERAARERLDGCVAQYVARVTGDLAERARRDPLTGLLNHTAFHARLSSEIGRARRYRGRLSLLLFDLDSFKETNDTLGHQEGDRLLRAFSSALSGTARESDAVGRLGGDEFGCLLLDPKRLSVRAFVNRLDDRLDGYVAFSAGAAYLPEECSTAEDLLRLADRRVYEDKSAKAA
jgi:diguanylate cyclase (GGDEF)-like protein